MGGDDEYIEVRDDADGDDHSNDHDDGPGGAGEDAEFDAVKQLLATAAGKVAEKERGDGGGGEVAEDAAMMGAAAAAAMWFGSGAPKKGFLLAADVVKKLTPCGLKEDVLRSIWSTAKVCASVWRHQYRAHVSTHRK